jgi:hypothetical protein
MSLSKIDKNHMNSLLATLNNKDLNVIECIKNNHAHYAKLKQIDKQIEHLKKEAYSVIRDAETQNELHSIGKTFKLVSGNYYFLYSKENTNINTDTNTDEKIKKYFSLISPLEWSNKDTFVGKYLYDYDKQFILQED